MLCTKEQLLPHCTNDGGNARAPVRCYFQLLLAFICQNHSTRKASSITHTHTIVPKEYPHPTPGPSWPDLLVQVVFAFLTLIFSSDQHQSAGVETCGERGREGGYNSPAYDHRQCKDFHEGELLAAAQLYHRFFCPFFREALLNFTQVLFGHCPPTVHQMKDNFIIFFGTFLCFSFLILNV